MERSIARWESGRNDALRGSAGSQSTRELLEYLITQGTEADLSCADPGWFKAPPEDDGAFEWYCQFGDASKVLRGREALLQMVVDLRRTSKAPAAVALNAAAWFEEWVELSHPLLGLRSPSQVLCTPEGLEAVKVILRSLQARAILSNSESRKRTEQRSV